METSATLLKPGSLLAGQDIQHPLLLSFLLLDSISELEDPAYSSKALNHRSAFFHVCMCQFVLSLLCMWERMERIALFFWKRSKAPYVSQKRNKMSYSSLISYSQFSKRKERNSCWSVLAILAVKIICLSPVKVWRTACTCGLGEIEKREGEKSHLLGAS